MSGGLDRSAPSGGETVTNLNPERHIIVSYTPGTENLRAMTGDRERLQDDSKALREAADLLDSLKPEVAS